MMNTHNMTHKFLNYIDEAINFGSANITGEELLAQFSWEQGLNRVQTVKLRTALENKGVL